jgi:hypothetical protein
MPRNPTLRPKGSHLAVRPHRAPSETINIAPPEANKCRNCRHSIPSSQGLGERVTCLLFGETHPTFDHCCRWQTRD